MHLPQDGPEEHREHCATSMAACVRDDPPVQQKGAAEEAPDKLPGQATAAPL